jgi:hypothetical protein
MKPDKNAGSTNTGLHFFQSKNSHLVPKPYEMTGIEICNDSKWDRKDASLFLIIIIIITI